MRKHHLLAAICCLLSIYSCQKESIEELLPESNLLSTETTDESAYFKINTLEDLATFEELFVQNEKATSRSHFHGNVVHVPSNSKNAIQAAINSAGHYGVVYLEKGNHYEEQSIFITHPVFVVGRAGATVISSIPLGKTGIESSLFIINETNRVTIWGVALVGTGNEASAGISVISTSNTVLAKNTIKNFQNGIGLYKGNKALIWKNNIVATPRGLARQISPTAGVVVLSGPDIRILQNKISACVWGLLISDKDGLIQSNELFGNFLGVVLDFIPPVVEAPNGDLVGSEFPATNWTVQNNYSHDNFDLGYVVSFGANNNKLINNRGGNNGRFDLVLDTGRINDFGMPGPASFDNFVDTGNNKNFTIVDCGNNNEVVGGKWIPCN